MTAANPGEIILLAIDTAGSACSAAVLRGAEVVAAERLALRHGHAEALLPMIERVMNTAALPPARLDAVAVAIGPGGFTGIRVGLAAAHGIALAAAARLIGVTSFAAVAAGSALPQDDAAGALLVALDSRRADLYVQMFSHRSRMPLAAPIALLPEQLPEYVARSSGENPRGTTLLVAGDAAEEAAVAVGGRYRPAIVAGSAPDALGVAAAALPLLRTGETAPARPLYLRPPDVTLPARRNMPAAPLP